MVSIQVLATPISGCRKSWSVKPMALNMARAGARSRPSVIKRLRCLGSIEFSEKGMIQENNDRTNNDPTNNDPTNNDQRSMTGSRPASRVRQGGGFGA